MKTPPSASRDFSTLPVIKFGSRGEAVRILQSALASQGFYHAEVDGIFGQITHNAVVYYQQTHIGDLGAYLSSYTEPGVVDILLWKVLLSSDPASQRNFLDPFIPKGLSDLRRQVLRVALKDHADVVKEIPDGSNYGDGVTKYLEGIGAAYWCCYALSWWYKTATGVHPFDKRYGLCAALWADAKKLGRTYTKDPVPGDAFVLLYRKAGRLTGSGHTGLVAGVSEDGKRFSSIAGNEGNRVKAGNRSLDEPVLVGFVDVLGDASTVRPKFKRGCFERDDDLASSFESTR